MGAPDPVRLVELGPGRGTLMADALRAMAVMPGLSEAIDLHLVETSPTLRAAQGTRLQATWHNALAAVPPGAMLLVANEFFDALPIRQFILTGGAWRRRMVGVEGNELVFLGGEPEPGLGLAGKADDIFETSPASAGIVGEIAGRLASHPGAALIVDYGHITPGPGDTLQAVQNHQYAPVLAEPGEADLTAHVDFTALAEAARKAGAAVHGPLAQGAFLNSLGIRERADRLHQNTDPDQQREIAAALLRLTSADAMGELFKVMALSDAGAPPPAGFE
jgi:SAM-dependent MidA family methyltransferase